MDEFDQIIQEFNLCAAKYEKERWKYEPATQKQLNYLRHLKVEGIEFVEFKGEATELIAKALKDQKRAKRKKRKLVR